MCSRAHSSSRSMLAVSRLRLPPLVMAWRAFTARFIMTCSNWLGSAFTLPSLGSSLNSRWMSSPRSRATKFCMLFTTVFKFRIRGAMTCCRLKASNVGAVAALHLHFQPSPLFAFLIFLQQALAETRIEKHVMIKVELHQVSLGVVTQHGGESRIRGQELAAQRRAEDAVDGALHQG